MTESLTAKIPRMHSPVNRLVASVIGPGIRYEETFLVKSEIVSELPLPIRPYPIHSRTEDNLTGKTFGRFTVIGLSSTSPNWVVRCTCGRYCYRKSKVLKKIELDGESSVMCARCVNVEKKRKGFIGRDSYTKSLHAAALPMFQALKAILNDGLNAATRQRARDAMNIVGTKDSPECDKNSDATAR
jgi:hypothetical protein